MLAIASDRTPLHVITIHDEQQARLLTSPKSFLFFGPFLGRECTATEAAQQLSCRLDTLMYWLRKFVQHDLLLVTKRQGPRGRALNVYRSSADRYEIPFEATPYSELHERLMQHYALQDQVVADSFARVLRGSPMAGIRVYRGSDGSVCNETVFDDSPERETTRNMHAIDFGGSLHLPIEQARALEQELLALWSRYRTLSQPDNVDLPQFYWRVSFVSRPQE